MPRRTRMHFYGPIAGAAVYLAVASPAAADDLPPQQVTAAYTGTDEPADFAFVRDARGRGVRAAGLGTWAVPAGEFGTAGLGREFRSFDTFPSAVPEPGAVRTFTVRPADHPGGFAGPSDKGADDARADAVRRAGYVRELLGRAYPKDGWAADPAAARAFQVAVWEVVGEDRLPEFDLFGGRFRADYPDLEAAPPFVQRAQEYLNGLTGDDGPFREHPAFAGREVVQLVAETDSAGAAAVVLAVRQLGGPGVGGGDGDAAAAGATAGLGAFTPGLGNSGGGGFPGVFGGGGNGGDGTGNGGTRGGDGGQTGYGTGGNGPPLGGGTGSDPVGGTGPGGAPFGPSGSDPADLPAAPYAPVPKSPGGPSGNAPNWLTPGADTSGTNPPGGGQSATTSTPGGPGGRPNLVPAAVPAPAGLALAVAGAGAVLAGRAVTGRRKR